MESWHRLRRRRRMSSGKRTSFLLHLPKSVDRQKSEVWGLNYSIEVKLNVQRDSRRVENISVDRSIILSLSLIFTVEWYPFFGLAIRLGDDVLNRFVRLWSVCEPIDGNLTWIDPLSRMKRYTVHSLLRWAKMSAVGKTFFLDTMNAASVPRSRHDSIEGEHRQSTFRSWKTDAWNSPCSPMITMDVSSWRFSAAHLS